ncbi:MAG TPA: Wzz/FepE/Etk N-terminal domain-containing protein [Verrucomicrobiota bacterium]|nr:Wzz/FepE/Etk N-terminal domain-containing protein [Verrucomicrobiota bacterium]HNT15572.1 Wzz/FepE/Etk N-terminal domain-containing protein [Verrucomicrobiota bacterium]
MNSNLPDGTENTETPKGGIGLSDVLYTLFRYKFMVLGSVVLGVAVAAAIWIMRPPTYESTAKIYIPYVISLTPINPKDRETDVTPTIFGPDTVINTEIEMLRSFDTAIDVARHFGPEKILARYGGGSNLLDAAGVIANGLTVAPPRAMYMSATLSHRDPELVQPLLQGVVESYMHLHHDLRIGDTSNYVEQVNSAAKKISSIDEQLKNLRTQAGVPDLRERQVAISREYTELQSQMSRAQIELNRLKARQGETTEEAAPAAPAAPVVELTQEVLDAYSGLNAQIQDMKRLRQRALLVDDLTTNHPAVLKLDVKLQGLLRQKLALEQQHASLTNFPTGQLLSTANSVSNLPVVTVEMEQQSIERLARTVQADELMLTNLTEEAFRLMELEPKIAELERLRKAAEEDYEFYRATLEKAKKEESGQGGLANMQKMESPTPPKVNNKKLYKLLGAGFGGCVGLGLGAIALLGLVLDRAIRRPSQITRQLRMPLLLTIPDIRRAAGAWHWDAGKKLKVAKPDEEASSGAALASWAPDHGLQTYIEGLRERVITHFEARKFETYPKLVGVTACTVSAGVSTLASGLAASLSRTGRGSALLVDWNSGQGTTYSFYKGKAGYGPSQSFEVDADSDAASGAASSLTVTKHQEGRRANDRLADMLPPDFDEYVPNLKAEAYEYIVFDMACVTPASVSARMAGRMDIVLFVIEAGKTKDYAARYACGLMRESRANTVAVLNKFHNPVPDWLTQD